MSLSLRPLFYPSTSFFDPFFFDSEGADESGADANGKDASKQQLAARQRPSDFLTTFSNLGPKTDIHDCGDHVAVSVELPGVPRDAVHVSLDERRRLTISGEFKSSYESPAPSGEGEQQQQQQGGEKNAEQQAAAKQHRPRPLVTERTYGSFSRSFVLPRSVNTEGEVKATFDNGLLKIDIPKVPKPTEKQPRAIPIQ